MIDAHFWLELEAVAEAEERPYWVETVEPVPRRRRCWTFRFFEGTNEPTRLGVSELGFEHSHCVLEVKVYVDPKTPGAVVGAQMESGGRLNPSDMTRFPWGRWMQAAAALDVGRDEVGQAVEATSFRTQKRPGRRGYDPDFWRAIAAEYLGYQGDPDVGSPIRELVRKHKEPYSTVNGWVQKCRELGYLPPAPKRNRHGITGGNTITSGRIRTDGTR